MGFQPKKNSRIHRDFCRKLKNIFNNKSQSVGKTSDSSKDPNTYEVSLSDSIEKKSNDLMTPERLRNYWFSNQRVPFWNYDPNQLTIGLEIEYFIAKVHGDTFTLASKAQYLEVINHLVSNSGYVDRQLKDQPGRVSKDTSNGFIAIKPDFAWHILEIALPPRHTIPEIRALLESTFHDVDQALAKVGLERLDLSCLPDVPEKMDLVELDRLSGYQVESKQHSSCNALAFFPALIAATHVHINCCNEESLSKVPKLYEWEPKAQKLFTRAKEFQRKVYPNVRSTFYETAFGEKYLLRTTPSKVPSSLNDYVDLLNSSSKLFPNDPFFAVRDMSYIRPTRHGTFEFRSSCSYKNIEEILMIATFRKDQAIHAFLDKIDPRYVKRSG
ncbi:MAG: hypothetical protein NT027_20290 [Proteobacteria bacterium]|nr:hypothetical protein [Pseudomonadota bacterium]